MDDIAKLGIKIDSSDAENTTKVLNALTKSADGTASSTELLVSTFQKMAVVLGPTVLAGAFVHAIKGAIELEDHYVRLSEVAGVLASELSSLDLPARLSGTSLDTVAQSISRIQRSIGEAQLGDVAKKGLLKAIGIDPNDGASGRDRLIEVAHALESMKDKNVQAYVSNQLLGRSYAELRPFMKEVTEQGKLNARATDAQLLAAKQFEDELVKLNYAFENGKIAIANDSLPWLIDVVKSFAEGYKQGGLFESAIKGIQTAITGTDLYKANKEMVDLFNQMQEIEKKMDEMRANAKNGIPEMAVPGRGPQKQEDWQKILKELQERYETAKRYRDQLQSLADAKPEHGEGGAAKSAADAEKEVRNLMERNRMYEANVAAAKGFSERYSDAIRTGNTLIDEARKQGEMNEEDSIRAISKNEDLRLQVLIQSLNEQKRLHDEHGERGKSSEAQQAIEQANAARVANEAISSAKITSIRTIEELDYRRSIAQRSADQQIFFQDERTRLETWLAEQNNLNEIAFNIGLRDKEEYESRYAEIHAYYAEERGRITDDELKKRFNINKVHHKFDLDAASTFFSNMAALMQTKHRGLWEIGKLAAIGEVTINTARAAMGAYAALAPIPVVGPALATAAAAAAVLAGVAQVAQIKAQSFDGGGGGASGTFAASPTTGLPTAPIGQQNSPAPTGQTTIIHLNGEMFSEQQVRDLVERINENTRNGGIVIAR